MKICFWHSDKPRERILAEAFRDGARNAGEDVELRSLQPEIEVAECDVAVMVGVKSRELFRAHWSVGIHTIMIDKGYVRHAAPGAVKIWEYWRTAIDAHHPTATLMKIARPFDRIERLGIPITKWRKSGKQIVIAGSSQKYHDFYGLKDPTRYTEKLIRVIGEVRLKNNAQEREIIYRPKPSWKDAVPIEGSRFSSRDETLVQALEGAHCMVTHGSNACFEAIVLGVPCIILGDGVAKPISSTDLADLENPLLVPPSVRAQWLANLAYCQWTQPEFASGEAWATLKPQLYG